MFEFDKSNISIICYFLTWMSMCMYVYFHLCNEEIDIRYIFVRYTRNEDSGGFKEGGAQGLT